MKFREAIDRWDANSQLRMIVEGEIPNGDLSSRIAYKNDMAALQKLKNDAAADVRLITGETTEFSGKCDFDSPEESHASMLRISRDLHSLWQLPKLDTCGLDKEFSDRVDGPIPAKIRRYIKRLKRANFDYEYGFVKTCSLSGVRYDLVIKVCDVYLVLDSWSEGFSRLNDFIGGTTCRVLISIGLIVSMILVIGVLISPVDFALACGILFLGITPILATICFDLFRSWSGGLR